MSLFAYLDGVLVGTINIRLRSDGHDGIIGLPSAADGTGSVGGVLFDDAAGTLSVTGWQVVKVIEADCTSAPVLFFGYVADRTYRRSPTHPIDGREIDTSIVDSNTMLSCRIVTGASANRPSETQAARLAWLLASDAVADPAGGPPMFADLGLVNGSTKVLDAANYRGQYPAEVLNDLCTDREEIFFTYWDQALQRVGLFFDVPTATAFTSTISVSNVLSDVTRDANGIVTGTIYPPLVDGELSVDPQDVYSTGSMVYTGGTEYAIDPTTYSFFDAPSTILTRSFRVENDKVGRASTAHALLLRMLAADATERETLKFTVRLPSTKVGLVQAGMRIQCRFSHLPGFTSFAYTRIERLNYVPTEGDPTQYDVSVECSTHGLTTGIGSGGGSTDNFPYVPPTSTHYYEGSMAFDDTSGGGGGFGFAALPFTGTTTVACTNTDGAAFYPSVTYTGHVEISGTTPTDLAGMAVSLDTAAVYPPGTNQIGFTQTFANGANGTWDGTFTTSSTIAPGQIAYASAKAQPLANGNQVVTVSWWFDPDGWTPPAPPASGKPWGPVLPNETPNGSTVNFSMASGYTWASGSLRVWVDNLDQTAAVTAQDGSAGTFTLGFAPKTGELVQVYGVEI